ncbi:UPF0481 protein At3g47200-like [Abrus precatorius]|uniref:UPF0481 protein At3g47200-like n=1 Tax=Abrus precatorius TaxID=3816 RepID=A0A8B8MI29_ABRPR|nr:UPF0481 protein At3g47200-like [Abrus precatorius]XP_027367553.1 UPF0481 protein At3g47200-like [Abrus precatorius]
MVETSEAIVNTRLAQLKDAQQSFDKENKFQSPRIQRAPMFLRQNDKCAKYFSPKMISFGPIHHGSPSLKQGERYKLLWTSKFVAEYSEKTNQDKDVAAKLLLKRIEDNMEELKTLFTEDAIKDYKDKDSDLAWILFVDGCSLLHFLENIDEHRPESLNLKFDQLMYMWRDTALLENQLPRRLLEMLSNKDLEYLMSNCNDMGETKQRGMVTISIQNRKPIHLLDSRRSVFLSTLKEFPTDKYNEMEKEIDTILNQQKNDADECNIQIDTFSGWHTYKNIRDLKTAGIRVMPMADESDNYAWRWNNVSFTSKRFSGELRLPVFVFNDVTPYVFWNFIVYELCPDVGYNYECCSFFSFMDSLIDTAEDVKELRLAGVFQNLLGTDEDLAKLFNELGDDLATKMYCDKFYTHAVAYSKKYILVKEQIEKHYSNKWKTWLAEFYNTHFNTPWAMIAFLAALLALLLTFIQTWFAIYPKN